MTDLAEVTLVENEGDLQWPDTFAFDADGYLYATTNRLHRYDTNTLDFSQLNFRVIRVYTGSKSYMYPPTGEFSPENGANILQSSLLFTLCVIQLVYWQ